MWDPGFRNWLKEGIRAKTSEIQIRPVVLLVLLYQC